MVAADADDEHAIVSILTMVLMLVVKYDPLVAGEVCLFQMLMLMS